MKLKKIRPMDFIELVFDVMYLGVGLFIGLYLLFTSKGQERTLYGVLALVLIFGDSFHLIPRIMVAYTQNKRRYARALGNGKMITSITMTIFYVILWRIGVMHFGKMAMLSSESYTPMVFTPFWPYLVYALAIIRIGLCLLPQNAWLKAEHSLSRNERRWNIYRNIPFAALGIVVMVMFFLNRTAGDAFSYMWVAIFLSFGFYIPVVLGSREYPFLGALMLPKTCAYVWILFMGLGL